MRRLIPLFAAAVTFTLAACSFAAAPAEKQKSDKITVFLDAGHGKSSGAMSDEEKAASGWVQNSGGSWGEWRHWRDGQYGTDCEAHDGGAAAQPNACWYAIGQGDRDIEPEINLQICLSAKAYLDEMGYNVALSRETNEENPSVTKRIFEAVSADADLYVCVHSNAGGGRGTAYIAMSEDESYYALHRGDSGFAKNCNMLGKTVNDKIADCTSLPLHGNGCINSEPHLILFQKSPIPCAYLELGFYDNEHDLKILNAESEKIGQAIAEGIDEYCALYIN